MPATPRWVWICVPVRAPAANVLLSTLQHGFEIVSDVLEARRGVLVIMKRLSLEKQEPTFYLQFSFLFGARDGRVALPVGVYRSCYVSRSATSYLANGVGSFRASSQFVKILC